MKEMKRYAEEDVDKIYQEKSDELRILLNEDPDPETTQ